MSVERYLSECSKQVSQIASNYNQPKCLSRREQTHKLCMNIYLLNTLGSKKKKKKGTVDR